MDMSMGMMNMKTTVGMSRLRWALAGVLAVLTLIATVRSMRTYQVQEMTTGLVAVLALAVLLLVGLASLGMARLRIARELTALRGAAAGGELLTSRRRRLETIRASGTRPVAEILAEATRADEAGRAYIGRYLVATAVLIGLVGTFAALMQTLGKVAPLFGDKGGGDISSLVAPLAGLHVTFGASLVAILATLSLALAQGDLALCEEQALTLLEDRTTHELIPQLWPDHHDTAERTIRALQELKVTFADALGKSFEATLTGVSERARAQTERSARALETAAATMEKEVARLCATVESSMEKAAARQSQSLAEATKAQAGAQVEAAKAQAGALAEATALQAGALAEAAKAQASALAEATKLQAGVLAEATKVQAGALAGSTAAVAERLGEAGSKLMQDLRTQAEGAIARSAEAGSAALGAALAAAEATAERSTRAAEEAGARSAAAVAEMSRASGAAVAQSTARSAELLEEALQRTVRSADELLRGATEATETSALATAEAVTVALQPLLADAGTTAGRLVELTASLDTLGREHIASIDRSGQAVLAAFDRAVLGGGAALDAAAGTLAAAARDLQAGTQALAPRIGALTTELSALGREVALLLTSRGPEGDMGAVVLGELDRLGEGMERLTELVRLAAPRGGDIGAPDAEAAGDGVVEVAEGVEGVELESEPALEAPLDDGGIGRENEGLSAASHGEVSAPAAPDSGDETAS